MQEDAKKRAAWVVIAIILALGWIGGALIGTLGMVKLRQGERSIEVVGSAKKQVKSDLAGWTGSFSAQAKTTAQAYAVMKQSEKKVRAYLAARGLSEKDIAFSSITTTPVFATLPTGQSTNRIESYKLNQSVDVRSLDMAQIDDLSRNATSLINEGVEFQSSAPRYYYTKIADLKLDVLALAAQDAKLRADKIATNTGARAGRLTSASQGVFQITPLYSTEVSDSGVSDTSSIDKEITAVVICRFQIDK